MNEEKEINPFMGMKEQHKYEVIKMDNKERKKLNKELRMSAAIPKGMEDLNETTWKNKYNNCIITIVKRIVTDTGNVLWFSNTDEIYTIIDLNKHWHLISDTTEEEE